MEWLPIAVIAVFALIAALYLTVKPAVKDALKEYAKETRQGWMIAELRTMQGKWRCPH